MDLCIELFNWGELDIKFLSKKIEDWNIDTSELSERVSEFPLENNVPDISTYIWGVFELQADAVKKKVLELLKEEGVQFNEDKLDRYEVKIHENCCCSSFDESDEFWDTPVDDIEYDNIKDFQMRKIGEVFSMSNIERALVKKKQADLDQAFATGVKLVLA